MRSETHPLSADELNRMHAYWRAANYLSVGQIYLYDNPLLKEPLQRSHIKPRYSATGNDAGFESALRPLEPDHQESRPEHDLCDRSGARRTGARRQCVPRGYVQRGVPRHRAGRRRHEEAVQAIQLPRRDPESRCAGDARLHPRGRRARVRSLARVRCGIRQPGSDRRLRRRRRGGRNRPASRPAGIPIISESGTRRRGAADLHLNGYKIANPCFLARIPQDELQKLLEGYGYEPHFVVGDDPRRCIRSSPLRWMRSRRTSGDPARCADQGRHQATCVAMIVLRTPKGWTCPKEIDGKKCEGYWRAHQVPMADMDKLEHVRILEAG